MRAYPVVNITKLLPQAQHERLDVVPGAVLVIVVGGHAIEGGADRGIGSGVCILRDVGPATGQRKAESFIDIQEVLEAGQLGL